VGLSNGPDDGLDRCLVARHPGKGAVEIDDMQQFPPLLLPDAGLSGRGVVVDGILLHQPLLQTDAAAFLQIDGGYDEHANLSF